MKHVLVEETCVCTCNSDLYMYLSISSDENDATYHDEERPEIDVNHARIQSFSNIFINFEEKEQDFCDQLDEVDS